jgi:diguanylate cyclase (GGDEF)-like protein
LSFRIRAANAQIRSRKKVGEFYRQLSMVDGLTGLHNRAWLNQQLPSLIQAAHGGNQPLSIVMVDLDHFKRFNDTYGHLRGDDALQAAAKVLNSGLRPTDFAARYGGEEMLVILPETDLQAASIVAERLCQRLRSAPVFTESDKPLPHITGSFGVATLQGRRGFSEIAGSRRQRTVFRKTIRPQSGSLRSGTQQHELILPAFSAEKEAGIRSQTGEVLCVCK